VNGEFILATTNFFLVLIISFLAFNTSNATIYYVSVNGTSSGNGSFNNEWDVQTALNNASAGDTIYFKQGDYNLNYFHIQRGGTSEGNRVVFMAHDMANKPELYQTGNVSSSFVRIYYDYVTIDGLKFYGHTSTAKYILDVRNDYVTIKNGYSEYRAGEAWAIDNTFCHTSNNLRVINWDFNAAGHNLLNIQSSSTSNPSTSNNILIDGCTFRNAQWHHMINIFPRTDDPNPVYIDSVVIRNNYFHSSSGDALMSRWVRRFEIYNNVIVGAEVGFNTGDSVPADTIDVVYGIIANNTFIGNGGNRAITNWYLNGLTVKNNIFYGDFYRDRYIKFKKNYEGGSGLPIYRHTFDNNVYYQTDATQVWYFNGEYSTFSAWQTVISGDPNSFNSTPTFIDFGGGDYTLQEGSVGVDDGTSMSSHYNTDKEGITRPQGADWDIGAYEFISRGGDITPPEVTAATLLDTITIKITFSEPLDPLTAQNISNYSIDNNITVLNATLLTDMVTLLTSPHTPGTYIVTVNNVEDLAGNVIDPSANSANYELIGSSNFVNINIKIILEGPYSSSQMKQDLNTLNYIPNNQPYNINPWNYTGNENINVIPPGVVDWILIELRSSTSASSIVARQAAFVTTDGLVFNVNGEPLVQFDGISTGYYYLVVHHRNHLSIMSKNLLHLSESSELYDFTLSQNKAYGIQPMKELDNGKFGLYSADGNASGNINNADNKSIWRRQNGSKGYKSGDYDMNGGVNIKDKNSRYKPNKGKNTGVPN